MNHDDIAHCQHSEHDTTLSSQLVFKIPTEIVLKKYDSLDIS